MNEEEEREYVDRTIRQSRQRLMHDDWDRRFYEHTGEWPVQNLEHAPVRKGRLWRIFNATYCGRFADAREHSDAVFNEILRQANRERQER